MEDNRIRNFLCSAADLLQAAIQDAAADHPEEYSAVVASIRAGAMVSIHAEIAPTTGLAQLGVDVIEPCGTRHRLMSSALERMPTQ